MNRIFKKDKDYILETEDGQQFICKEWFEKKTNEWYIHLPKDNPSGREYIRKKKLIDDSIEFESKTTGPRVLGSSLDSLLTKEEKEEIAKLKNRIKEIEEAAKARKPEKLNLNDPESISREIARLMELKSKLVNR